MVAAGLLLSGCWHSGHHDTARPGFRSYAAWLEFGLSRRTKVAWAGQAFQTFSRRGPSPLNRWTSKSLLICCCCCCWWWWWWRWWWWWWWCTFPSIWGWLFTWYHETLEAKLHGGLAGPPLDPSVVYACDDSCDEKHRSWTPIGITCLRVVIKKETQKKKVESSRVDPVISSHLLAATPQPGQPQHGWVSVQPCSNRLTACVERSRPLQPRCLWVSPSSSRPAGSLFPLQLVSWRSCYNCHTLPGISCEISERRGIFFSFASSQKILRDIDRSW